MRDHINGGLWQPDSVDLEPETELYQWQVFEVSSPNSDRLDRHLAGTSSTDPGRVSSRLVDFDHEKRVGTTRSGRRYKLMGPPGFSSDAQYVWNSWLRIMRVDKDRVTNVSDQYFKEK